MKILTQGSPLLIKFCCPLDEFYTPLNTLVISKSEKVKTHLSIGINNN
jgi:hypothetical protein